MTDSLTVSVPTDQLLADVRDLLDPSLGIEVLQWTMDGPPPRDHIDVIVPPYMKQGPALARLAEVSYRLVQGQSIGYEGAADRLPAGTVYANAASVHETATAELALALALAAQRELPRIVHGQDRAAWEGFRSAGLADRRVLLLGYGGVGKATAARLAPFEVDVVPVASSARDEDGVRVRGVDELAELLPTADILIVTLPGGDSTRHLIDNAAMSALPDGALIVNVGRGPVVDTDALVDHVGRGRLRAALDVVDPEPLPSEHPLWKLDGALIAPHVGGNSGAMRPRIARLVAAQAERLARGEEPANVVIRT